MAWQDQLDDLIGGDGAQPVGDNQPYKFFPQGKEQWYAPQGGRPLGVGRGTADPEMRKYMMNMPSMNQLRSRTGINFPEQAQTDESGRRSMPLTPQIQDQLQKSGDFERMMPYAPKPKPEDIEKVPMSQNADPPPGFQLVQAGDSNFYWEGQAPRKNRGQGNIETNIPPFSRAPTRPGPQSGHEDPDLQDQIFGYQRSEEGQTDPRDIGTIGAGRYRVGRPEQRQFPLPGEQPDVRSPPARQPEDDVKQYGGPRPMWAPPDAPASKASDKPRQPGWGGMLDDMLGGDGVNHVPQSTWRTMLDNLSFIGTAEARGARPPSTHPSQGPEPPGAPPIGTRQQQPDGTFKTYVGGGQWQEGEYTPPVKPKKEGAAEKHTITPSEYSLKLWEEAQRHKTGQGPENVPPWFDDKGDINWDKAFDPKYGVFPLNVPAINRQLTDENLGRMKRGFEQIDNALKGEEPNTSTIERWGALIGGGLGYGTGYQAVEAVSRSLLGQPLENVTGFPKEYTEFAIGLGIPGLGLPRTPAMAARPLARSQYRTLQKEASIDPLNVTPTSPAGSPGWLSQQQEFQQYVSGMKQKPQVPGYRPEGQTLQSMQWFEKTFSPETAGPTAQDASASLREYLGMGEREAAQAYDMMNRGTLWGERGASFYKQVERSGEAPAQSAYKHIPGWNSKDELAAYLDGSPKAVTPDPNSPMGVIAYKVRQAIEKATKEWEKTLPEEQRKFLRDKYLMHKWSNWEESGTGQATEAGRGSLRGATMEERSRMAKDYALGRENGLTPAYDNPLDAAMKSIVEMRRDITQHNMIEVGKDAGTVRSAEGSKADALTKNGYVEIAGRPGLYAPENWARIYNNFYDSGFRGGAKSALDTMRHFTNANTQFLLGLSMYHAFTMGEATMGTQLARVFANTMPQIKEEGWWGAGKSFVDALEVPFAPLTYYGRGGKAQNAFLYPEGMSPQVQRAASFLTRANWRPMGSSAYTPDVAISGATEKFGTFTDSLRRGTFLRDLTAGGFVSNIGRTMDSVNQFLFKTYIPRIKAGVNLRRMQDVLEREPNLSETEYLDRARDIVNSTDNRFGEMVQDNIFWNRGLKQSLMLGMLSYSWTMGGAREWGGGGRDIARFMTGQAMLTPKAQYVIASSMIWGLMNTMAQRLHTGSYPWEEPTLTDPDGKPHKTEMWQGLMGYYTGGWVQRYMPPNPDQWGKPFAKGERVWEPEQGRVPGYMKDVIGFLHHPLVELEGKIGSGPRNVWELGITGKDYFDRPIYEPRSKVNLMDQIPRWAKNAWDHMVDQGFPITLQNLGFGGKRLNPMTGLNTPEIIMGMQPAQTVLSHPYRELTDQYFKTQEWQKKQRSEEAAKKREQEMRLRRRDLEYGGAQ